MSESPKNRRANAEDDSRGLLRAVKHTMNKVTFPNMPDFCCYHSPSVRVKLKTEGHNAYDEGL